ncbi:MAG: c-type cytochrome [Candidatus Methylomirabilales bacterium]
MGKAVWKVAAFVLGINLAFVYVGYTITTVSGRRGGMEAALMEVSPEAGEKIFWGKGKCSTCHSIGSKGSAIRCPNQGVLLPKFPVPLWERAATRVDGKTAAEYVVESVYNPSAYVVEGYSDGVMPHVKNPPIALTDDEILSVLVYLVSTSKEDGEVGGETLSALVRAQQPYKTGQIQVKETVAKLQLPEGDPEFGRDVFEEMKCYTCHKVEGEKFPTRKEDEGGVGPDLTDIGGVQTQLYLFESVINPNAVIVQGEGFVGDDELSKMPEYHDTLNLRDLVDLVAFLSSLGAEQAEAQ